MTLVITIPDTAKEHIGLYYKLLHISVREPSEWPIPTEPTTAKQNVKHPDFGHIVVDDWKSTGTDRIKRSAAHNKNTMIRYIPTVTVSTRRSGSGLLGLSIAVSFVNNFFLTSF